MRHPTVFISHGGPNIVIDPSPARDYLASLSSRVGKPRAIVIASAHFETQGAVVVSDPAPGTIYDFGGFAPELHQIVYPAPGDPQLAMRIADMLEKSGIDARLATKRGYDHGTWTAMKLAFPDATIPIVQVSIDPDRDASYHYALGHALSPLREDGVLIVGSGHITHNLRAVFGAMRGSAGQNEEMAARVEAFTGWFADEFAKGDRQRILDWKRLAPHVRDNHPSDEHLTPLFFAYGAAGDEAAAERAHASRQYGFFAFDSWIFR